MSEETINDYIVSLQMYVWITKESAVQHPYIHPIMLFRWLRLTIKIVAVSSPKPSQISHDQYQWCAAPMIHHQDHNPLTYKLLSETGRFQTPPLWSLKRPSWPTTIVQEPWVSQNNSSSLAELCRYLKKIIGVSIPQQWCIDGACIKSQLQWT